MTKMKPNHILILLLVYIAALSAMASYLEVMHIAEPQWSVILTSLLASSLIFWWYWTDSTLRAYRRSPLLNVAVIAVAFVAIPYYLIRSRPSGQRLRAVASMLGFVALLVVALFIGALPVVLLS